MAALCAGVVLSALALTPPLGATVPAVDPTGGLLPGRVEQQGPDRWVVDGSLWETDAVMVTAARPGVVGIELPRGMTAQRLLGVIDAAATGVKPVTHSAAASGVELAFAIAGQPLVRLPYRAGSFSLDLSSSADPAGAADRAGRADTAGTADPAHRSVVAMEASVVSTDPCRDAPTVSLTDLAVTTVGTMEHPQTFADFFPTVLDRLVIRIDRKDASAAGTAQAVIDLAEFAAHRWPAARVVVTDRDVELSPFDRVVRLQQAAPRGIALVRSGASTILVIGGPSERGPGLVSFIASSRFDASFEAQGDPQPVPSTRRATEPFVALSDIRRGAVTAMGQGEATVSVQLEQARFGGQMASITATVNGVARSNGTGAVTVQLRANDRILATKRVGNDEAFELSGTVSTPSIAADNVFEVRASDLAGTSQWPERGAPAATDAPVASVTGSTGCAPGSVRPTVTVELDPTSSFEGTPGNGVEGGFARFPQAFADGFEIRMMQRTFPELVAAAAMVELLQHRSPVILAGRVIDDPSGAVDQFNHPTLFVSTHSSVADLFPGSLAGSAGTLPATTPRPATAALSAVGGSTADHLLLVSGDDGGITRLLAPTRSDLRGLRALRGDLLIERAGVTKNLRVQMDARPSVVRRPVVSQSRVGYPVWFGFVSGCLIAMFVVVNRHRSGHS